MKILTFILLTVFGFQIDSTFNKEISPAYELLNGTWSVKENDSNIEKITFRKDGVVIFHNADGNLSQNYKITDISDKIYGEVGTPITWKTLFSFDVEKINDKNLLLSFSNDNKKVNTLTLLKVQKRKTEIDYR